MNLVINMKVKVGISLRHVHLTEEDYKLLFDEELSVKKYLGQPGQFAAEQTVTLERNGKVLENVRIIGPFRKCTQVEISKTDAYFFKIDPPVRTSGDLSGAENIIITGKKGKIERKACILADRHIHINKEEREKYGLDKDVYRIKINGEKGGILDNVHIREREDFSFELHIDSDEGNAFALKQKDEVEIID